MKTFFLACALIFGPTMIYVWLAVHPDTGRVFLSCTGKEPKLRQHFLYEL